MKTKLKNWQGNRKGVYERQYRQI